MTAEDHKNLLSVTPELDVKKSIFKPIFIILFLIGLGTVICTVIFTSAIWEERCMAATDASTYPSAQSPLSFASSRVGFHATFNLGACPANLTSCEAGTGIYSPGCCKEALPQGGQFCCPHGFPNCGDKSCCPSGYPVGCAGGLCCPEGTRCHDGTCVDGEVVASTCSSCGGTCCQTNVGDLCCPFSNGVCCGDKLHCCPGGYSCGKFGDKDACVIPAIDTKKTESLSTGVLKKPMEVNQSYAFVPVSKTVMSTCYEEASKIYCSYTDANWATVSCLMKQRTGACAVFPSSCWNIVPAGGPCYDTEAACDTPTAGSCTWYIGCLQKKFNCPLDGYPISYGFSYCQKFIENLNHFTPAGRQWIQHVLLCLQNALVPLYDDKSKTVTSCDKLTNLAFESHAKCYLEGSPTFCDIAKDSQNLVALFWDIYKVKDLITWKAIVQEIQVVLGCTDKENLYAQPLPLLPLVIFNK